MGVGGRGGGKGINLNLLTQSRSNIVGNLGKGVGGGSFIYKYSVFLDPSTSGSVKLQFESSIILFYSIILQILSSPMNLSCSPDFSIQ